jgi:hypothetical protein
MKLWEWIKQKLRRKTKRSKEKYFAGRASSYRLDLIGNKNVDVRSRCSRLVRCLHLADSRSAGCADRRRSQS